MAEARTDWLRYVSLASLVVSVVALLLGTGFFWDNIWNVADVRYTILPGYDIPPQAFSGLTIENRGRKTAEGVWIKLTFSPATIRQWKIDSDEPWIVKGGGSEGDDHIEIWLDRITPGSSVKAYFITDRIIDFEKRLVVTWKEGRGKPSRAQSTLESSFFIVAPLLGFLLASFLGSAIWYVKWTWGLLKRPILVQKEVRDTTRKSWQDFRGGAHHGCLRILIFLLLSVIIILFICHLLMGR